MMEEEKVGEDFVQVWKKGTLAATVGEVKQHGWALGYGLVLLFDSMALVVQGGVVGWSFSAPTFSAIAPLVVYGLAAAFPVAVARLADSRFFLSLVVLLACAGVFVGGWEALGFGETPIPLKVAASLAFELFRSVFMLAFFSLICRLRITVVVSTLLTCHLFASLAALVAQGIFMPVVQVVLLASLPLFALRTLRGLRKTVGQGESGEKALSASSALLPLLARLYRPFLLLVVVLFTSAVARIFVPSADEALSYLGVLGASLVVVAVLGCGGKVVSFRFLYHASLVFLVGALWCVALGPSAGWAVGILTNGGYTLFILFADALFCDACLRYGVNSWRLFGIAGLGIEVGYTAGAASGLSLASSPALTVAQGAFGIGCLLVLAFLAFMTEKDYRTSWGTSQMEKERPSIVDFYDNLGSTCAAVAQQYGLSRREQEVLILLAQRKTTSEIEAELFISESTVKSHRKAIYRKLSIHKKEELLELVGHPAMKS